MLRQVVGRLATTGLIADATKLQSRIGPQLVSVMVGRSMATDQQYGYETLKVTEVADRVANVELNRPQVRNAMSLQMFKDVVDCFDKLAADKYYRAIVLSGAGKIFCAGIDLMALQQAALSIDTDDVSRKALALKKIIRNFQMPAQRIFECPKPVIAATHSASVGGAIDWIGACDIRYCSQDAWFSIREVDIGIVADIGTMQFVPRAIGNQSLLNELLFTGRKFDANEAKELGFVSKICADQEAVKKAAIETAAEIAKKSPVTIQGIKNCKQYTDEHGWRDSFLYQTVWNMSQLQSPDTMKAAMAAATKSPPPEFEDMV